MSAGKARVRPNAVIGAVLTTTVLLSILLGLVWTPYNPAAIDLSDPLAAPSLAHWWGTDNFGRDVLSRAMLGARISVFISLSATAIAVVVGSGLGLLSGFLRGWTDRLLMIFVNALLAFPGILLALALVAVLGSGIPSIILALAIAYIPSVVRVVRGSVLSIREREYIQASRLAGDGTLYIILRHVLPNTMPAITVLATSLFGWAILSESALSFLGVGVPPPAPTWGNMLSSARPFLEVASWLSIVPGACIAFTLLGVNLLGDALRDRLDSKDIT